MRHFDQSTVVNMVVNVPGATEVVDVPIGTVGHHHGRFVVIAVKATRTCHHHLCCGIVGVNGQMVLQVVVQVLLRLVNVLLFVLQMMVVHG